MILLGKRRPKLKTKEELIKYLEEHKDTELPFNEEVWNIAVEKTKDKERKYKEIVVKDFDGNEKKKSIPNGAVNPVSKYFMLMALPQYRKKTEKEDTEDNEDIDFKQFKNNTRSFDDDIEEDDIEEDDDTDNENENKEVTITGWINMFFDKYSATDKKFLKERLINYFDNYELNNGADIMIVVKAVADELEIMKLTNKRIKGEDVEKRLETVQKGYLSLLESFKALKKQRSALDEEGKNKFTLWVDRLEKEGFNPEKTKYSKDDVDFIIDTFRETITQSFLKG